MNPDPKHNDCSIPEEEEEDPDARLRAHLRLWARRLRGAEEAEVRLPLPHGTRAARRHRPVGEQVNAYTFFLSPPAPCQDQGAKRRDGKSGERRK